MEKYFSHQFQKYNVFIIKYPPPFADGIINWYELFEGQFDTMYQDP